MLFMFIVAKPGDGFLNGMEFKPPYWYMCFQIPRHCYFSVSYDHVLCPYEEFGKLPQYSMNSQLQAAKLTIQSTLYETQ